MKEIDWEAVAYLMAYDEGYTKLLAKIAQSTYENKMQDVQILVNSAIEEWAMAQLC